MPAKMNGPTPAGEKELQEENDDLRSRPRQIGGLAASRDAEYKQDPQSQFDDITKIAEPEGEEDLDDEDDEDDEDEEDDDEEDDDEEDDDEDEE